ncbi:endonuclease III domain-containing protein [Candidatus Marsarchaeota archaeon]|nr:endonuclease III domain-containing protein [Candidatus Marsarchaeota archaeon]MCL5404686.1 endonuclease III domain-containing protein [Candidatus Marsarchaeota archaeon]
MRLYKALYSRFGFLNWWPGETKDEVLIGAILTQQTSWRNVERAIANIKAHNLLSISAISEASPEELESLVKPAGYYRQKSKRLIGICRFIIGNYGSLETLFRLDGAELRRVLLSIKGIGPETADSIMLYSAEKLSFVVDAYTKRVMSRVYGFSEDASYEQLKGLFERSIKPDLVLYKDFHAQFVELGKRYCKTRPACSECPALKLCRYGSASMQRF